MQSVSRKINVAIVGGGIGGLSLAISLLKHQHLGVDVYEAAHEFSEIGAGISLGANAQRALLQITPESAEKFRALLTPNSWPSYKYTFFRYLFGQGPRAGEQIVRTESETGSQTIHRARFLDLLASHIPPSNAHFNKRLVNIDECPDGQLQLHFKDGTTALADCVIGADGIHSPTRRFVLGDEAVEGGRFGPQFTGSVAYRHIVPMDEARRVLGDEIASNAHLLVGYGSNMTIYPIDGGTTMNVNIADTSVKTWDGPSVQKADIDAIRARFADYGETGRNLVSLLDPVHTKAWSMWDLPEIPTWTKGRIAIMGDAAHATTPFQGAGAGQAIEDAFVLGAVLGLVDSVDEISSAFEAFDKVRRPRASRVTALSREAGELISLRLPKCMDDPEKLREDLNWRFDWIWNRDIDGERRQTNSLFERLRDASSVQA